MKTIALLALVAFSAFAVVSGSYEAPDDCEWSPVEGGGGGVALTCHLSAVNSNLEGTDFSVIPASGTRSRTVQCSESEAISSLEARGFDSLVDLDDLAIVGCRLERIPRGAFAGLRGLWTLTVRSTADEMLVQE